LTCFLLLFVVLSLSCFTSKNLASA